MSRTPAETTTVGIIETASIWVRFLRALTFTFGNQFLARSESQALLTSASPERRNSMRYSVLSWHLPTVSRLVQILTNAVDAFETNLLTTTRFVSGGRTSLKVKIASEISRTRYGFCMGLPAVLPENKDKNIFDEDQSSCYCIFGKN